MKFELIPNDEDCFQEALGIMKVQMDEMDACPNCTESKACDKHRNMFDEERIKNDKE